MCIHRLDLIKSSQESGTARLKIAGELIFEIDLATFDEIGAPGAGSGERTVALDPVPFDEGEHMELDLSDCRNCEDLIVAFTADVVEPSPS
jgi:hypothetical protein